MHRNNIAKKLFDIDNKLFFASLRKEFYVTWMHQPLAMTAAKKINGTKNNTIISEGTILIGQEYIYTY